MIVYLYTWLYKQISISFNILDTKTHHSIYIIYIYQQLCNSRHCRPELHCGVLSIYIYSIYIYYIVWYCNVLDQMCVLFRVHCRDQCMVFWCVASMPTASSALSSCQILKSTNSKRGKHVPSCNRTISNMAMENPQLVQCVPLKPPFRVWGLFQPCFMTFMTPEGLCFKTWSCTHL